MAEYSICGPWMLQVNWTFVVVKGNKFVTDVKIKATVDSKLTCNKSPVCSRGN